MSLVLNKMIFIYCLHYQDDADSVNWKVNSIWNNDSPGLSAWQDYDDDVHHREPLGNNLATRLVNRYKSFKGR